MNPQTKRESLSSGNVRDVPEVRRFIKKLFDAMPYFPYYFHPAPQLGMGVMFFASLADRAALRADGHLELTHDGFYKNVIMSVMAARAAAPKLGCPPDTATGHVLALWPEDYQKWLKACLRNMAK